MPTNMNRFSQYSQQIESSGYLLSYVYTFSFPIAIGQIGAKSYFYSK